MSTITVPRALLDQALEALKGFLRFAAIHSDGPDASDKYLAEDYAEEAFLKAAKVLPDLRAALAQQQQSVAEKFRAAFGAPPAPTADQSAINWLKARPHIEAFIDGMGYTMTLTDERVRFEAREKVDVRAQQEQEPVAWIQPDHLQKARQAPFLCRVEPTKRMSDFVPIYTHPPRREWVSLTEEEMHRLYRRAGLEAYYPRDGVVQYEYERRLDAYARAVEQALKERNT